MPRTRPPYLARKTHLPITFGRPEWSPKSTSIRRRLSEKSSPSTTEHPHQTHVASQIWAWTARRFPGVRTAKIRAEILDDRWVDLLAAGSQRGRSRRNTRPG